MRKNIQKGKGCSIQSNTSVPGCIPDVNMSQYKCPCGFLPLDGSTHNRYPLSNNPPPLNKLVGGNRKSKITNKKSKILKKTKNNKLKTFLRRKKNNIQKFIKNPVQNTKKNLNQLSKSLKESFKKGTTGMDKPIKFTKSQIRKISNLFKSKNKTKKNTKTKK